MTERNAILLILFMLCSHLLFVSALSSDEREAEDNTSLRRMIEELKDIVLHQEQRLSDLETRCKSLEGHNAVMSNEVNKLHEMIQKQNTVIQNLIQKQSANEYEVKNTTRMLESVIRNSSPGKATLKSERSSGLLNFRKERLLATVTALPPTNENTVAFYAYSTHTFTSPSSLFVLTFDTVITNVGNGYHHHSGIFIAPRTGLYVFTWSFRIQNDAHISTELIVNESSKSAVYFDATSGVGGNEAGTVVTHVNQGDDVFIRVTQMNNLGDILSDRIGRTSFGGWMIS